MDADDASLHAELQALLSEGRKLEAIRLYRERTGAGLMESKDAVEALARGEPPAEAGPMDSALQSEILSLLEQARKIEAIKLYRERTGAGLKEAKVAVEALAADRHVAPSRSGCLGLVLLAVLLLAVAAVVAGDPAGLPATGGGIPGWLGVLALLSLDGK